MGYRRGCCCRSLVNTATGANTRSPNHYVTLPEKNKPILDRAHIHGETAMKQDNSIHMFHSLKDLVLGVMIGAMLLYIITTSTCITPAPWLQSPVQKERGEQLISPPPTPIVSPTPESEDKRR